MNKWRFGEKEFLLELHKRFGCVGLTWRDDCIERPIAPDLNLVYSIDSTRRWLSHNSQDDARIFGRWAASVISSDVIACGVPPKGLALDVGVNAFYNEEEMFTFFDGVLDVCSHYGMTYEGGNLNKDALISGVAWGTQLPNKIIHRDGAQDNSILIATAPIGLGWAYDLYQRMEMWRDADIPFELLSEVQDYKNRSVVNLKAFEEVWDLNAIDCGMDLTDGIIEFGYEIYDRTGLGVLFSPTQPHPFVKRMALQLNIFPEDIMFEPGYDTPLSHGWCVKSENVDKVLDILRKSRVPFTILGEVTSMISGVCRKTESGNLPLPRYWDDKLKSEGSYDLWKKNIVNYKKSEGD